MSAVTDLGAEATAGRGWLAKNWIGGKVGEPTSAQAGGRLAAILFVLCGLLVGVTVLLPLPDGGSRFGLIGVGMAAVVTGVVHWLLPWSRWKPSASLWGVVPAFVLITAHNHFTGDDGYRYGLFFLVVFVWVGLAHPPGTSIRISPGLVTVYILPLWLSAHPSPAALASLAYTAPVSVLLGETTAWVSERLRQSQGALRSSEARWRSLVMNASDLIVVIAADGTVQYATPAVSRLFGYPEAKTVGMQVLDLIHPDDLNFVVERLAVSVEGTKAPELIEFRVARADGSFIWVESIGTNLLDEPSVQGIVCNVRDISDRKKAQDVLVQQARHDPLTGLPNRLALMDAIAERLETPDVAFALLLMDLDRFKEVNDGLGHNTGDRVLVEVASRIRSAVRAGHTVARLGGDEFALVIHDVDSVAEAGLVAAHLRRLLDEPFEVDGMALHLGGSIGIAWSDGAPTNVTALLQRADVAMYRAKESGLGWALFGPQDEQNRPARLAMVTDLRNALDAGEIEVHYQPQAEAGTGRVFQVEALARWRRNGEMVPPDEFIPLAEHTGLIRPLTVTVLTQALAQCRQWADTGLDISVAVNVSAPSLRDPDLVGLVGASLARAGVPSHQLTLEITEHALAEQTDVVVGVMQRLRALGVRLSIDDFGSGYSSMAYLKRLPIDELKIDRSFITEMLSDSRDRSITKAIIELAHSLELTVVGEGVESPEVEHILAGLACDVVQGYGLCRPLPGPELTHWLSRRVPTAVALAG